MSESLELKMVFCYNEQSSENAPKAIRVNYQGKTQWVPQDGVPVHMSMQLPPPLENGLMSMVFEEDYYPLNLYCDGFELWIPVPAADGSLSVLTPFLMNEIAKFVIYPITAGTEPGTVTMMATNKTDTGDPGLGVIIVGTSGLVDTGGTD